MLKILLFLISVSTALVFACRDKHPCSSWYRKSDCTGSFKRWMEKNCAKFCGQCSTGGSGNGKCGMVKVGTSRIVGGTTAKPGAWPWQVILYNKKKFHCGGSLVNENWIVTAAHCVRYSRASSFTVVLGDHNRQISEGSEQEISVSRIVYHPKFHYYEQFNNDIALVRLSRPVQFTNRIQPICLPAQGEKQAVGSKCYITGWGKMQDPGDSVNILRQLKLAVQTNTDCHKKNSWIYPVTPNMICGANPSALHHEGGCHGDSGGPFACRESNGSWKLQGVVSWGSYRCNKDYTVFARVAQFRNWIDQYIKN